MRLETAADCKLKIENGKLTICNLASGNAPFVGILLLLCGCVREWPRYHSVRQQFVPASGSASSGGATWSNLVPAPHHPGVSWAEARAGIGDSFPVQEEVGQTAFNVVVTEGDDEHLIVELRSSEGAQRVGLGRDKSESVHLGGRDYELLYPTVTVSTADITTTSKALIIVTRR
jgi:hypothetical protein